MTHSAVCEADSGGVGQLKHNPPVLLQILVVDYAPVLVTAFLLDRGQASWDSVPYHGGLVAKLQMAKAGAGLNLHPWISLLILFCVLQGPRLKMLLSLVKRYLSVQIVSVWSPYLFIGLQSQWVALFVFKGGGWLHAILTYAYVLYQIIMRTFGLGKLLCFCATTLSWKILIPNPSSGGNSCHILYMCDLRDKEWSKVPLCVHTPLCVVPDSSHSDLRWYVHLYIYMHACVYQ